MRLSRALDEKKMDVRLRDKLIAESKITKDDVNRYQGTLDDEIQNATTTDEVDSQKKAQKVTE